VQVYIVFTENLSRAVVVGSCTNYLWMRMHIAYVVVTVACVFCVTSIYRPVPALQTEWCTTLVCTASQPGSPHQGWEEQARQ
jgi:hypothetical protein